MVFLIKILDVVTGLSAQMTKTALVIASWRQEGIDRDKISHCWSAPLSPVRLCHRLSRLPWGAESNLPFNRYPDSTSKSLLSSRQFIGTSLPSVSPPLRSPRPPSDPQARRSQRELVQLQQYSSSAPFLPLICRSRLRFHLRWQLSVYFSPMLRLLWIQALMELLLRHWCRRTNEQRLVWVYIWSNGARVQGNPCWHVFSLELPFPVFSNCACHYLFKCLHFMVYNWKSEVADILVEFWIPHVEDSLQINLGSKSSCFFRTQDDAEWALYLGCLLWIIGIQQ